MCVVHYPEELATYDGLQDGNGERPIDVWC